MNFVLDNRVQTFDLKGESCKRFTFLFTAMLIVLKQNALLLLSKKGYEHKMPRSR